MSYARRYPVVLNLLVIAVTVVFVALALVVGRAQAEEAPVIRVGQPSPQDFVAPRFIRIEDAAATEAAREAAAASVQTIFAKDPLASNSAKNTVRAFFQAIREAAFIPIGEVPSTPEPTGPVDPLEPPTPTSPPSTTAAPTTTEPETTTTEAAAAGAETTVVEETTTTTAAPTTTTQPPETTTTSTTLPRREEERQIELVQDEFSLYASVIPFFVGFYNDDLDAQIVGEPPVLDDVEAQILEIVDNELAEGIRDTELTNRQNELVANPPDVFAPGLDAQRTSELEAAAAFVIAQALRVNEHPDLVATQAERDTRAAAVDKIYVDFVASQPIVSQGELITTVKFEALVESGLVDVIVPDESASLVVEESASSRLAIATLGALAVLLAAFFLWRIAPSEWSEPKHFVLLGVLLVLAALAARLPQVLSPENPELRYTLPAVMFGYIAAILYDPRTAVLMAVPIATFTGAATGDPALTVFAGAATVVPVAFVSSVSSRRQLRVAVMLSAVVLAPLAGTIAWWFEGSGAVLEAAAFAIVGGVLAGLVAQGLLSFLENLFRVTTTLTLLDLTDRNHPALRLIEEQAPGTFNHSILVGTLAGKAARAIGADPLLAQAAAFYHDLGKTQNPQFFIENQFGVSNPHDELPAEESAEIIRSHVIDGLRLARQYRIPEEVAAGIRTHHGTGLMRYFYHKALDGDPGADPELFRHGGVKPRRKEMAILMISDACEAAARSLALHEDPTADSIKKLVNSVVGEKLEDGQLDESDLTFGDLTRIKHAIVEALIGYYHTRIPYPGFPGPRVEEA